MEEKFSIGDIVLSKAGRDSGRYFVVVSSEGIFTYICDGDLHKIEKPKKKKIKHLKNTGSTNESIAKKLLGKTMVTNPELRCAVLAFKEEFAEKDF
ncbi:MAG: RNA-binding protein [Clostridia bacterium]|nr:RNA-binding protein [Clostridia bacterium]